MTLNRLMSSEFWKVLGKDFYPFFLEEILLRISHAEDEESVRSVQ